LGILGVAVLGCAKPKVWMPPRMDVRAYGTLGLIEFSATTGYGPLATRQFVADLHAAQAGVPVLELGTLTQVLRAVEREALDPETVRAIGRHYEVDVVVAGDLEIESPQPNFSLHSFTEANVSADIHGRLSARFLDAGSGATIWSEHAQGKRTLAQLHVAAGQRPSLGAVDPQGEEAKLVEWLVWRTTDDFRGRWVRP
jgi:hypothetical protein